MVSETNLTPFTCYLEPWSSNFMCMRYLGTCSNTDCWDSPSEFLRSDLRPDNFCFCNKFLGEADAAGLETILGEPLVQSLVLVKVM